MKKSFVVLLMALVGITAVAQEELQPTQLGKWTRPAKTKIEAVDKYIDSCAVFYENAMDIRKQYEAIDTLTLNVGEAMEIAQNEGETLTTKKAEYEALLKRVEKQKESALALPALAESAVKSVPLGLKAISITKSIASTKDAVKLAMEENVQLLKAITKQLTTLSTAPVTEE